ncbi:hypothetical protein HU200_033057 [Digitaria exilis]|uniref:Uncharacterized protein n=1 Tax=Digitaria exilis TaxID=1010633 RepID=A0A835ENE9_9POAL|nr:hypothetical protein HU200_033057 [Digitaria exilis]
MFLKARQSFDNCFFRKVVILACWAIWCHWNSIIFYNGTRSFANRTLRGR